MSDGNGGWIYYYTLDEVTVTGTTSGGDKPSPGYQPYTPTWPGSIPTGMGDDGGPGYPGPLAEGEVEMAIIMGNRRIMLKSHPRSQTIHER